MDLFRRVKWIATVLDSMTTNSENELSSIEKLVRTEARTNDDGTVQVEVLDWSEESGTITVEFLTPINDRESERMPFPQPGGNLYEYKFYRILQSHSIPMRKAELLSGKMVNAKQKRSGKWEIVAPKNESVISKSNKKFGEVITAIKRINLKSAISVTISVLWVFILFMFAVGILVMLL